MRSSNKSPRESVTPWFNGTARPWHEGVYQRRFPAGPYSCWDGTQWRHDAVSALAAARQTQPSRWQQTPWRGSLQPPPEHCLTCRGSGVIDQGPDPQTGDDLIDPCPDC